MNLIAIIIICVLIELRVNQILCELIFEDDFNELDSNKWTVISLKGNCAGNIYLTIC